MNSWVALVRKEFLLTRGIFVGGLIFIFIVWGFSFVLDSFISSERNALTLQVNSMTFAGPAMLTLMSAGIFMHFLYLSVYIIISMQKEMDTLHWWLHSPKSMPALLLAKLTSGVISIICSLLVNGSIVLFLIISTNVMAEISVGDIILLAVQGGLLVVLTSLYLSICVLFFIAVYLTLRGRIGNWSWVVVILLFIVISSMSEKISESSFYNAITHWGEFELRAISTFRLGTAHMGEMLFHIILAVVIFVISALLIDRKVEV
ncbi:hypothetical protein [Alteribacillus iranensis]|uniref:ABC-2 type transport system permease protein n=1 Tax=Alteribacillus iranensis TaxID=930128 RepID=A0A1I2DL55_9BACI|nr:hypothetical protein [Alteribacillus iranensis]SFE81345.1 hypothetical protein SAMN05192532_104148 [Alteribacillus iranensis]